MGQILMLRITLVCVGKLKERYWREAVAEYEKRLGRYCRLDIAEVADEPAPEQCSPAQEAEIRNREGERILHALPAGSLPVALDLGGKERSSEELSAWLDGTVLRGASHIAFIIGGSLGLSDAVLAAAKEKLSFSRLTFPHQLMRVIFLEQLYRSFRISRGEPYHK